MTLDGSGLRSDPPRPTLQSAALLVLTGLVVTGLLVGSLLVVRRAFQEADEADDTSAAAEVTGATLELILAVQEEREQAVVTLAEGARPGPELADARNRVDQSLAALRDSWEDDRGELPESVAQPVDEHLAEFDLSPLRGDVATGEISVDDARAGYTDPIAGLIETSAALVRAEEDVDEVRGRVVLNAFVDTIEAAAQERAIVAGAAAREGPLGAEALQDLLTARSVEQESTEQVARFASLEIRQALDEIRRGDDSLDQDLLPEILDSLGDGSDRGTQDGAALQGWFEASEQRISSLAGLARDLNMDLVESARDDQDSARRTAQLTIVVVAAALVLAVLLVLAVIRADRRRRDAERSVRRIAETLQRSLLPPHLPDVEGITAAARYEPSAEHARIGGDWYEMIPFTEHCTGFAMGDVLGHGVEAAALTSRLRHSLSSHALSAEGPAATLRALDQELSTLDRSREAMATLVYAEVDTEAGTLRYCNAGHPAPLLRRPDGAVDHLDEIHGALVGTHLQPDYTETELDLQPGSMLVLYTDGLVERRGEPLDVGIDRLANLLARAPDAPAAVADLLVETLIDPRSHRDDTAVLVVRFEGVPASESGDGRGDGPSTLAAPTSRPPRS